MIYTVEGATLGKKDRNRITILVHIICMCIPTQLGRQYSDLIVGSLYVPQRKKQTSFYIKRIHVLFQRVFRFRYRSLYDLLLKYII